MNLERTLTDELRAVADAVDAPPPPVAALVRRAERARTRTRTGRTAALGLVAAAVVAAIVLGTQLDRPDATPPPTGPTPTQAPSRASSQTLTPGRFATGAPLRTSVDERGNLYVDGVSEAGSWNSATTFGDLTLGYFGGPAGVKVAVFVGTRRVGTIDRTDDGAGVEVSPDRHTIAWVEPAGTVGSIVVATVTTGGLHELGRLSVATLLLGADDQRSERLLGVGNDHTATYGGVTGGHAWTPGSRPRAADVSAYLSGPQGFPSQAQDVVVNPAGTWGAWLAAPGDPGAAGQQQQLTTVSFEQPNRPDTRTTIAMPVRDNDVRGLSWESDADVILTIHGDNGVVVRHLRCNVLDRTCAYAPQPTPR